MKIIRSLFNDLLIICLLFLQGDPIDVANKEIKDKNCCLGAEMYYLIIN